MQFHVIYAESSQSTHVDEDITVGWHGLRDSAKYIDLQTQYRHAACSPQAAERDLADETVLLLESDVGCRIGYNRMWDVQWLNVVRCLFRMIRI